MKHILTGKERQAGFTMVELLVAMTIFVLTIAAASAIFVPLLTQFKQQSRAAETQIEAIVGLEILRRDIEQAGFGLPWVIPTVVTYQEGSGNTTGTIPAPNTYNDCSGAAPCNPPRPILSGNNVSGAALNGSDYLVIKATNVALNDAATKWTDVTGTAGGGRMVKTWGSSMEDLNNGERIIVLIPSRGVTNQRILVNDGATFYTQFNSDPTAFPAAFSPGIAGDVYLIYGVDSDTDLRMPFNRADYYIRRVAGTNIPPRCAPGTGFLMKSVINQSNGDRGPGTPLMDCVADMQVIFRLDTTGDGTVDSDTDDISVLSAQEIRDQLKEVRVYILAHEGQKDVGYNAATQYPTGKVTVGQFNLGRPGDFDLTTITDWQRYRWKVYTLAVKPRNTR